MYKKVNWPLTLYFDGECPLCAREIKFLQGRAAKERLLFVDISSGEFDAGALGLTFEQMQFSLHARFADGRWLTGLDATLWSWRAAGLGFWATPLTWRVLRPLLEFGYRLFCRLRPHLAWLPHPEGARRCFDNRCEVPASKPAVHVEKLRVETGSPAPFLKSGDTAVLFDGTCKLCNGWARFIIHYDHACRIQLAAVQSPEGQELLKWSGLPLDEFNTIVLISNNKVSLRSEAMFEILSRLDAPWRWLKAARVVPAGMRDWMYDKIALNRYRLFGRYDSVQLPSADHDRRFLKANR